MEYQKSWKKEVFKFILKNRCDFTWEKFSEIKFSLLVFTVKWNGNFFSRFFEKRIWRLFERFWIFWIINEIKSRKRKRRISFFVNINVNFFLDVKKILCIEIWDRNIEFFKKKSFESFKYLSFFKKCRFLKTLG